MRIPISLLAFLPLTFLLFACGNSSNSSMNTSFFSGGTSLVPVTDPREGAFTIQMPKGWKGEASLERVSDQTRSRGFAKSPDGSSMLFFGDVKMPIFWMPNPQMNIREGMSLGPVTQVRSYQPANIFFESYVRNQYGKLPGFRLVSNQPHPELQQRVEAVAAKYGVQALITTTAVAFDFDDNGKTIHGQINGTTYRMQGIWMVDVHGYLTEDNPADMETLMQKVMASFETSPEWQARENQRQQQRNAAMQAQTRQIDEQTRLNTMAHNQRMADMKQNFDSHQRMMQDRYAANDAYNQAWSNNQNSQDGQHERFVDMIREEETVTNGAYQGKVEAGYNQYYVNPNTGEYIGTNNMQNPNASVYELWKKKY